jgi:hypothetical protein
MFHVRSSTEGSQESISAILTVIWQIVSNVNGIIFKDLKQTLKKEQCEVKKGNFDFKIILTQYLG